VFGAVCVTEVKAFQFNARAVRDRCAADPAFGNELSRRVLQVVAGRLMDTTNKLVTRSFDASPYAAA